MFVHEWALFVGVTLDAGDIGADGKLGLLGLKAAVRVVTVAALHGAL